MIVTDKNGNILRVRDTVKQVRNVSTGENPIAIITAINDDDISHIHEGETNINTAGPEDFILIQTNWEQYL